MSFLSTFTKEDFLAYWYNMNLNVEAADWTSLQVSLKG